MWGWGVAQGLNSAVPTGTGPRTVLYGQMASAVPVPGISSPERRPKMGWFYCLLDMGHHATIRFVCGSKPLFFAFSSQKIRY